MPQMTYAPSQPKSVDEEIETFGEEAPAEPAAPSFAQYQAPERITQKSMSVPPPPPSAGAQGAGGMAGYTPESEKRTSGMAPAQDLLARKKRPVAPASRFVPFWLTVLILAALLALIAWWLAS